MDQSPLDRLPPEIRASIFTLALRPDSDIDVDLLAGDAPLTRTRRQLRDETLVMYHNLNTRMRIHVPPHSTTMAAFQHVKISADQGKLRFLEHLRVLIEYTTCRRPDPDRATIVNDQCVSLAYLLAQEVGLGQMQVAWEAVRPGDEQFHDLDSRRSKSRTRRPEAITQSMRSQWRFPDG